MCYDAFLAGGIENFTGKPFGQSTATVPATQTILHDAAHPSAIVIPVIPASGQGSDRFPIAH